MPRPTATSAGAPLGARPAGNPCASVVPGTAKIMCLGDSWTDGAGYTGDSKAFRELLVLRFADLGVAVDMVGPYETGAFSDNQHAGFPGKKLSDMATDAPAWCATYTPDVCIVIGGLNDAREPVSGATINTRMSTLLAALWTARPGMRVVACYIPTTSTTSATEGFLRDANALFGATFAASAQNGANLLRACDLRGTVPSTSTLDCADITPHPTPRSFERIADALWPVVLNALGRDAEW